MLSPSLNRLFVSSVQSRKTVGAQELITRYLSLQREERNKVRLLLELIKRDPSDRKGSSGRARVQIAVVYRLTFVHCIEIINVRSIA